eukprot:1159502-Pelagomonas_calceolata.AAC.4
MRDGCLAVIKPTEKSISQAATYMSTFCLHPCRFSFIPLTLIFTPTFWLHACRQGGHSTGSWKACHPFCCCCKRWRGALGATVAGAAATTANTAATAATAAAARGGSGRAVTSFARRPAGGRKGVHPAQRAALHYVPAIPCILHNVRGCNAHHVPTYPCFVFNPTLLIIGRKGSGGGRSALAVVLHVLGSQLCVLCFALSCCRWALTFVFFPQHWTAVFWLFFMPAYFAITLRNEPQHTGKNRRESATDF